MKTIRVLNQTRNTVVCAHCEIAATFVTRVRGLLGRTGLAPDEGLLIIPCPSIHMFGMKFPIDVIFITPENVVTDIVEAIAPGKIHNAKNHHGKPYAAIELPVGAIRASQTGLGDQLIPEEISA